MGDVGPLGVLGDPRGPAGLEGLAEARDRVLALAENRWPASSGAARRISPPTTVGTPAARQDLVQDFAGRHPRQHHDVRLEQAAVAQGSMLRSTTQAASAGEQRGL
jgi:hypothetical protein